MRFGGSGVDLLLVQNEFTRIIFGRVNCVSDIAFLIARLFGNSGNIVRIREALDSLIFHLTLPARRIPPRRTCNRRRACRAARLAATTPLANTSETDWDQPKPGSKPGLPSERCT